MTRLKGQREGYRRCIPKTAVLNSKEDEDPSDIGAGRGHGYLKKKLRPHPYQLIRTLEVLRYNAFGAFLLRNGMVFGTFPSTGSVRPFLRVGQGVGQTQNGRKGTLKNSYAINKEKLNSFLLEFSLNFPAQGRYIVSSR